MYEVFKDFTLLCVDDDQAVLDILTKSFQKLFKHIYTASNGLEGYKLYETYNPDILITDITMPICDGLELIEKIRQTNNKIPIYITSAIEDSETLLKSINYGVSGYIIKPIDIKQLLIKLENSAKILSYETLQAKHKKELEELNNSLELKVKAQTLELQKFNENLQKKVQEEIEKNFLAAKELLNYKQFSHISELITNLSHQWRQPLSIISALAGGIKINRNFGIDNPEQEQKDLNQIIKTTKDLSATIEKLRIFTRDNQVDKNSFELNTTILDVIKIVEGRFVEDSIVIKKDLKDHIMIKSYSKEFATIMLELLLNAKESINRANKTKKELFISTHKIDDNSAEIIIKDTGTGFDEKNIDRVFDPYFSTKFNSCDVGLSLYFVKEHIQKLFNGSIKVSNHEEGAQVNIILSNIKEPSIQEDKEHEPSRVDK